MNTLRFEWDPGKHTINVKKHGVSFDEAVSVFSDENALLIDDPDHSIEEERFILLGMSSHFRMLIVVHCYREHDNVVRIISSRKATTREQRQYHER